MVWWGYSSCSVSLKTMEQSAFCGASGQRVVFNIHTQRGTNITQFSAYPKEEEVLLRAGTELVVKSSAVLGDLCIVEVCEVMGDFGMVE